MVVTRYVGKRSKLQRIWNYRILVSYVLIPSIFANGYVQYAVPGTHFQCQPMKIEVFHWSCFRHMYIITRFSIVLHQPFFLSFEENNFPLQTDFGHYLKTSSSSKSLAMNALTKSARIVLPRTKTLSQVRTKTHFADFDKKHWVSDAGAYPVMGIIVFACGFCSWRLAVSSSSPDVRIMPSARQNLIRPHQN